MSLSSVNLNCTESWPSMPANTFDSSHTFLSQLEIPKLSRCPMSQLSEEFVNRVPIDNINQSSVQFYTSDGTFLGMGVALRDRTVLTCNHLFNELDANTGVRLIYNNQSFDVPLRSRRCHDRLDAALFTVEGLNPESVDLSLESPVGGRLIVSYQSECGPFVSTGDMTEHQYLSSHFQFNCDLIPGTSGSGVWNSQGELVGIHFWDEKSFGQCRRFIPVSHLREFLGLDESFDSVMLPSSQDPSAIYWHRRLSPLENGNYEVYQAPMIPVFVTSLIEDLALNGVSLDNVKETLNKLLASCHSGYAYFDTFPNLSKYKYEFKQLSDNKLIGFLKKEIQSRVNIVENALTQELPEMETLIESYGYTRLQPQLSKDKFTKKSPISAQFISSDGKFIVSVDVVEHAGKAVKGYRLYSNKYEHIGTYGPDFKFLGHGKESKIYKTISQLPIKN